MTRRGNGEDSIYFEAGRGRWVGAVSLGFAPDGKRKVKRVTGKTKTAVHDKLRELHRELDKGVVPKAGYTVSQCLDDWLAQPRNSTKTLETDRYNAENVRARLGRRLLRDLTGREVQAALDSMTVTHSSRTIKLARDALKRAIRLAEANDLVGRNVAALVIPPKGTKGRPSKSLTLPQALAVIEAAKTMPTMYAYVVVSLLAGLRTEEVRALRWTDVDLNDSVIYVVRAARAGGDTKTKKSRRGLRVHQLVAEALRGQLLVQARQGQEAGPLWQEHGLVFASAVGTIRLPGNVLRDFRTLLQAVPGINPAGWTPREMRHTFVSLLSDTGMPIEEIGRLLGHAGGSAVTETVYRHQLRPVVESGAQAMGAIFGG